ncbi:hypothetical protein [Paenibacillus crassostreae]|uniref:DUF2642 domain-containing protein n=1 Tax=Paenibacillus crassostreae TaxID=1763538 RepID=A0A167EJE9_9BACL|nr:hypothetical protein [Paenibacillus crassostreae]AOZ94918.1 hypothetical protein LPB68_21905 [Paenibacillus crassostreae]OAB75600.1 hypothetical protein PNBC_08195 [Paenibacillus crassostreae]
MIEELRIAAMYHQRVILTLQDGDLITGVVEMSTDPTRVKIRCIDGLVWVPYEDIVNVNRLITLH